MRQILLGLLMGMGTGPIVHADNGNFLARKSPQDVRVLTYNINWDSIFPANDPHNHRFREHDRSEAFVRILKAVNADVVCLQEIGERRPAGDVLRILEQAVPAPAGREWYIYKAADDVIASIYPLRMPAGDTAPPTNRGLAMALVDLPDQMHRRDLYVIDTHFKAAGGTKNIARRQQEADAIVHWIADARQTGGRIDLPHLTPIVILGDMNAYDTDPQHHVTTLVTGDIADERRYGPDIAPDWDSTAMTDALPHHNAGLPEVYTWRDDTGQYNPGPLDRVIYTDSVLRIANAFVLDTSKMAPEELQNAGLEAGDVALNAATGLFDHLPVVVDFIIPPPATGDADGDGRVGLTDFAVFEECAASASPKQGCDFLDPCVQTFDFDLDFDVDDGDFPYFQSRFQGE